MATYHHPAGDRLRDENFVNDYIASGKNVLTLILNPPAGEEEPGPTAQAVVELLSVERGDSITDGDLLAQVAWPAPDTPPPPRSYPQIVSTEVDVDATDHRGWRDGVPLTLDDATRAAILKLLRRLTNALTARDLATTMDLMRTKVTERAAAFGSPAADNLADLRDNYGELMRRPDWGVEPWKDDEAIMEVVGNGQLVSVTNKEHRPLIRSADLGGFRMVIPTNVALLEGQWVVLR